MVPSAPGGIAAASALQEIDERAFDLPHRGMKGILILLAWLAVSIGASLLTGWVVPGLRRSGGRALLGVAGRAWLTRLSVVHDAGSCWRG